MAWWVVLTVLGWAMAGMGACGGDAFETSLFGEEVDGGRPDGSAASGGSGSVGGDGGSPTGGTTSSSVGGDGGGGATATGSSVGGGGSTGDPASSSSSGGVGGNGGSSATVGSGGVGGGPCVPTTCALAKVYCGQIDDGCGTMLDCGGNYYADTTINGVCVGEEVKCDNPPVPPNGPDNTPPPNDTCTPAGWGWCCEVFP